MKFRITDDDGQLVAKVEIADKWTRFLNILASEETLPPVSPLPTSRPCLTPKEFAAVFGRSVTWVYRRIYAGKINTIPDTRPALIPAGEVERMMARATTFQGK